MLDRADPPVFLEKNFRTVCCLGRISEGQCALFLFLRFCEPPFLRIEVVLPGIAQRKIKHSSCTRVAARPDAKNLERPLGRSVAWRQSLHLSYAICQLLHSVPGSAPHRHGKRNQET